MPATEQAWYNQKLLHVIFACSSVVLLIATVWMFSADHLTEWKGYQREFRSVERRLTAWQQTQEASASQSEYERLEGELLTERSVVPSKGLYNRFKAEAARDAKRREVTPPDFGQADRWFNQLTELAKIAAQKRQVLKDSEAKVPKAAALVAARRKQESEAAQSGKQATLRAATDERKKAEAIAAKVDQEVAGKKSQAVDAEQRVAAVRQDWLDQLTEVVRKARFREDRLLGLRKFKTADYDATRAALDLAIGAGRDTEPLQRQVTELKEGQGGVDELNLSYQAAASHRQQLLETQDQITAREREIDKELADNRADLVRLASALEDRTATYFSSSYPFLGKRVLELPILDAFNSPLQIDNLWTENLTMENGSFGRVRRFDRCTTCHQAIDQTRPGSATEPAYASEQEVVVTLNTPASPPKPERGKDGKPLPLTLKQVYGIELADRGLINNDDVTISYVRPASLAARAAVNAARSPTTDAENGLKVGDVVRLVNNDPVLSPQEVRRFLVETVSWGQPIQLTVQRGLPNPYASHPRLDLFVGSLSPHTLAEMGCTVCHEGQGSATTFKWASHTPNTPGQAENWARDHDWFNNHHWIFPMFPKRFAESSCLKCHHEVTELEPSERFPEPPAPKLVHGYNVARQYGCFGCHEINGYNGPDMRVGPDLRLEPNFFAAAAQVTSDDGFDSLSAEQRSWAQQLIQHPERDQVRGRLRELLEQDAAANDPMLTPRSHQMADVLKNIEIEGTRRKVGPSLRYVEDKLGAEFLFDWVRQPNRFRPNTRMPQLFNLWNHLEGDGLHTAEQYEPVEILGITNYLLEKSQPWSNTPAAEGIADSTREQQIARGKLLFESRGCLACHKHADFAGHQADQGPDLTDLQDKLLAPGTADGRAWLVSWLKSPTSYSPRTKMPNLLLEPITDEQGNTTDPAADIAEYLLSGKMGQRPIADDVAGYLREPDAQALEEVALEHLRGTFFHTDAERYLKEGIPESMRPRLKGPEVELVGTFRDAEDAKRKVLLYVGRKTISKAGCFACHDIPGFEDAQPIGTALTDWGRKDPSRLAFEHIVEYLQNGEHGAHRSGHHVTDGDAESSSDPNERADEDFDESFYEHQLEQHDRVGFLWQKLKEPRSYDYAKTENKGYLERLRMPQFPLTDQQREAVATFVLGLVADPPAEEFLYHPTPRKQAIVQGRQVLDKFNCGGCHMLEPERWEIGYSPGAFGPAPRVTDPDFPAVLPHFATEQLAAFTQEDPFRGVLRTTITGVPAIDNNNGRPVIWDEEGDVIEEGEQYAPDSLVYGFELWEPAVLDGEVRPVGQRTLAIGATMIRKRYPSLGGDFTKQFLTRAIELEKQVNPNANGREAWGWLPPSLHTQGSKVQPSWLHDFLLDPHPIRPAVLMRMPRFNMTSAEATKLVDYFAASDDAEYPYVFDPRTRSEHLEEAESVYRERVSQLVGSESSPGDLRLDHAMNIVVSSDYCVKCHTVADFVPEGSPRTNGPDLSNVYRRLRPDYVRRWIAKPTSVAPYTGMPVNIKYNPDLPHEGGVKQDLYHGTSTEQLEALVDLLMNYDRYASQHSLITPLVEKATATAADGETEEEETESVEAE